MIKWLNILGVLVIALALLCGCGQPTTHSLRTSVDETRRQLRKQGFKTDLADFDFALPAEINARATAITTAGQSVRSLRNAYELQLMEWVGTNAALAISPVETHATANLWPLVRNELAPHRETLDLICASLAVGPVKFQPVIRTSGDILLPYLANYKTLARALGLRAVLAMHDSNTNGVFTNVFALSRQVTGWTPEPFEIAHFVRFACAAIAQQAIWELLQTDYPNETELAALQREWESAGFFDGLPATAEASCASMVAMCQADRSQSHSANVGGWGPALRDVVGSPVRGVRNLWRALQDHRRRVNYLKRGTFEDEKVLLLYYRARNQELRRAVACSNWGEMKAPGITNVIAFHGAEGSRIGATINLKRVAVSSQGRGRSLMTGAAEAEARRRLIVTAIALKRFAIRHGTYPQSLSQLVPAFVPAVPIDFMDGRELRYSRGEDGRYVLYSVGLDSIDNGGTMPNLGRRFVTGDLEFLPNRGADLVWPRRATQADVDAFERAQQDYENKRYIAREKFRQTSNN